MEFRPVVPISDETPEPPIEQQSDTIVDEAIKQTQLTIAKYKDRLKQCGGESAFAVLLEEVLPGIQKYALVEALKKEGDLLTVLVNAVRFYLSVVYLGGGAEGGETQAGGTPKRKRRVADEEDEEEYRQQLMKEVAKQIAAQTIAEYERSRQQQSVLPGMEGNPLAMALGQYIMGALQQRLGSVLGGQAMGPAQPILQQPSIQTPNTQAQSQQQSQQKKKIVDLTEL